MESLMFRTGVDNFPSFIGILVDENKLQQVWNNFKTTNTIKKILGEKLGVMKIRSCTKGSNSWTNFAYNYAKGR